MQFAQWVFRVAGVYGLLVLLPQYFLEQRIGIDQPPAITHPEFFYGFVGVGLAWQVAFLIIGQDPARYRPLMIAAVIEKFTFAAATTILFLTGRLAPQMAIAGTIDLTLGFLFTVAWFKTAPQRG